MINRQKK